LGYWIGLARTNYGLVLIVIPDLGRSGHKMGLTSVIKCWFCRNWCTGFHGTWIRIFRDTFCNGFHGNGESIFHRIRTIGFIGYLFWFFWILEWKF
jgi:hypothetical protein